MTQPSVSRPNILWIFGDQHRAQALSCHGDPNVNTPNIDRLAAEGIDAECAYSGFPLCCPARGSLLTGRFAHHVVRGHQLPLPDGQRTLAHSFEENGYETAWFGKWHLDGFQEREGRAAFHTVPRERRGGFRTWLGYENNNSQWDCHVHGHTADGAEVAHVKLPGYETDALTDRLIEFLGDHDAADAPFFAALSVQPPHDPYVAPEDRMRDHQPADLVLRPNVPPVERIANEARRNLAGYYAMIENLDWNLGRIRATLDELGLTENTHIIFFSDHGDQHGSQGQFHKTSPWEESVRVPLIFAGGVPYYRDPNGRVRHLIGLHDLAPTTLGLCGIVPPSEMDGTDFSGLRIKDKPRPERPESAFLHVLEPTMHPHSVDREWRGVISDDGWKLVCFANTPWLLFNLNEDPYELANHAHNVVHKGTRERLLNMLREWLRKTGDDFPLSC